jgi:CAAX protease family protein
MSPGPDEDPSGSDPEPLASTGPSLSARVVALLEVLLCSDYPTQLALGSTLMALGYTPNAANGELQIGFVVTLSLVDTALLLGLIVFFLMAHGERPRDVFLGRRPAVSEVSFGLPLVLVALAIGVVLLAAIQLLAPSLHTVGHNPLQDLIRSPRDIWWFALIVVIAGGVREELQRAFLLHRFEHWLGGAKAGLVITSLSFGVGHLLQGADAAITTGTLGVFWGMVYLRRRSAIAPIVSHSGFNLLQIAQFLAIGR